MKPASKIISPPKWANRFLEWYCAPDLVDEIQGDLLEAFQYRNAEIGMTRAKWWFIWDVLRFFRPSSFSKRNFNSNSTAMFKNYLKVSLRNFSKNKVYSSINLSGLIVGITACLLITLHVMEELSYDNFHPRAADTYRVVMDMYNGTQLSTKSAPVYPAVGPNLEKDFPEVEASLRILPFGGGVYSVRQDDGSLVRFNEENAVLADSSFFQMFGFKLIDGTKAQALSEGQQIAISESTARKYFGDQNPVGKTIIWRGTREATVTAVFEDFPENSHMQFDMITSTKSWNGYENWITNWGWYDFYTFITLSKNADVAAFEKKLEDYLVDKKAEWYAESSAREVLWLQPIQDIHLYSKDISWDMGENGGAENIYFLGAIAALILIIAWVNFINLSTARAVKRAKEVGLRKVVGAGKSQLVIQFLIEAFLYNLAAVLVSIGLVLMLIPVINSGLGITLESQLMWTPIVLGSLFILILLGTLVSGTYPAILLTSFKSIEVLKGNVYQRRKKLGFRQVLVVFQFIASITLILGTLLVVKQLKYLRSQDLGFNSEQILVVNGATSSRGDGDLSNRMLQFRDRLSQLPAVTGFTASNIVPGRENFAIGSYFTKHFPNVARDVYRINTDEGFITNFEIDLLAGRNFAKEFVTDTASILLNETAVKHLGFGSAEEALGEKLDFNQEYPWTIIGVVSDHHHASPKQSLDPIAYFNRRGAPSRYYSLKMNTTDYRAVLQSIESTWDEIYPDNPFEYFFLDEFFDRQYNSDEQFNSAFIAFAGLAIFVACLGLFGLVSFTAEQSKKEISIRKVLGASSTKVVMLLAKDYAKLVLASIIVAFPLAYYLMSQWLQGFAYQTSIGVGMFAVGGLLIATIAFVTVSFKSFNVANSNPVNSLREE